MPIFTFLRRVWKNSSSSGSIFYKQEKHTLIITLCFNDTNTPKHTHIVINNKLSILQRGVVSFIWSRFKVSQCKEENSPNCTQRRPHYAISGHLRVLHTRTLTHTPVILHETEHRKSKTKEQESVHKSDAPDTKIKGSIKP